MSRLKKIITVILIASTMLMSVSLVISAEASQTAYQEHILTTDIPEEFPENNELLWGYLEKELYPSVSLFGRSAYDLLNDTEKSIYNTLKAKIIAVAAGQQTSTSFEISSGLSSFSWTASELGVSSLLNQGALTSQSKTAINQKIFSLIDTGDIMRALIADLPCELFWFDKTVGMQTSYGTSVSGSRVSVSKFIFSFCVTYDYRGNSEYATNTSKTGAITQAKQTAQEIVSKHQNKSDIEKLIAYKDEICALVDYYDGNLSGDYGNPWQLIWVFDKNASTNVVCEGYSKAFKYLCDLSTFSSEVFCYTVTGTLTASRNSGPHMWNLVEVQSKNYLVDITNTDDGSIGDDGSLFMAGASSSLNGQTHYIGQTYYTYDANNIANYLEDGVYLPVSQTSYSYDIQRTHTLTVAGGSGSGSYAQGAIVTVTATEVNENKKFEGWNVTSGNVTLQNPYDETITFIMPSFDITIVATYHIHHFSEEFSSNKNEHWYECECSDKSQISAHSYEKTVTVEPTCEQLGMATYLCECGYEYEQGLERLPHSYDDGVVTKQATLYESGVKKFTCKECGDYYLELIPELSQSNNSDDTNSNASDNSQSNNDTNNQDSSMPNVSDEPMLTGGCLSTLSSSAIALICSMGLAFTFAKKKRE